MSKFGGPVPECLEEAVPGLSWGDCPSPTPGEAGCTWSRRKEGEKVRLQGFPGVLFPGEIMGMKRKEGGGTFSSPLKKKESTSLAYLPRTLSLLQVPERHPRSSIHLTEEEAEAWRRTGSPSTPYPMPTHTGIVRRGSCQA